MHLSQCNVMTSLVVQKKSNWINADVKQFTNKIYPTPRPPYLPRFLYRIDIFSKELYLKKKKITVCEGMQINSFSIFNHSFYLKNDAQFNFIGS